MIFNLLAAIAWTIITTLAVVEEEATLAAVGGVVITLNVVLVMLRLYK